VPIGTTGALAASLWLATSTAVAPDRRVPLWGAFRGLVARLLVRDEPCELPRVTPGRVEPGALERVVAVRKKAWEAALGGEEAARPHVRARLAGWPARPLAERSVPGETDDEFVARLARDTWRGLAAFTDRENGLPVDHVRLGPTPTDDRVGDYVNGASIGLRLIATVAAYELALVSRAEAVAQLGRLLDTLRRLETHAGFFFNYYDTTSLERTSNFVSFVDSSWLTAGLMVARTTFPELAGECTGLIAAGDYRFFYDGERRRMSHGYWVHRRSRSEYHYGVLYAESRLGSLIAIGKGDVPEEHWFAMVRTFSGTCGWQRQTPRGRRRKTVRDHAFFGGWYEWRGTRYVPSWGGSMFEALMPTLVLDEVRWAPESLGENGAAHAQVQRRWALEVLGHPVWGMSPSSTPAGDGYAEYGVEPLGSLGYPPGPVTPHAAALALAVMPQAAIANLRALAERYGGYGEFGFYDAVDPGSGNVARTYFALDQAMTLVAAANHLRDGCVQKRFAADPIAARALPILGAERFFE
jgi:hypothetical protein